METPVSLGPPLLAGYKWQMEIPGACTPSGTRKIHGEVQRVDLEACVGGGIFVVSLASLPFLIFQRGRAMEISRSGVIGPE